MRQGIVKYNNTKAGILTEDDNGEYLFVYDESMPKPTRTNSSPFKCQYQQDHTEVKDCFRFLMD
jgi:hypothetical protein